MSILICDRCDAPVDTDADPDAIIAPPTCIPFVKALQEIVCEPCREAAWDRMNERLSEESI